MAGNIQQPGGNPARAFTRQKVTHRLRELRVCEPVRRPGLHRQQAEVDVAARQHHLLAGRV